MAPRKLRSIKPACWASGEGPEPGQSLAEKFPDIAKQFVADAEGKDRTPETVGCGSEARFKWECEACGNQWSAMVCEPHSWTGLPPASTSRSLP
jgi:hypothetical protein